MNEIEQLKQTATALYWEIHFLQDQIDTAMSQYDLFMNNRTHVSLLYNNAVVSLCTLIDFVTSSQEYGYTTQLREREAQTWEESLCYREQQLQAQNQWCLDFTSSLNQDEQDLWTREQNLIERTKINNDGTIKLEIMIEAAQNIDDLSEESSDCESD